MNHIQESKKRIVLLCTACMHLAEETRHRSLGGTEASKEDQSILVVHET